MRFTTVSDLNATVTVFPFIFDGLDPEGWCERWLSCSRGLNFRDRSGSLDFSGRKTIRFWKFGRKKLRIIIECLSSINRFIHLEFISESGSPDFEVNATRSCLDNIPVTALNQ
jgi:hypothetical protein